MHPDKFLGRSREAAPVTSEAEKAERLEALGTLIASKRKEAVDARKSSGIEDVWTRCEEAYLGIDDMNRHEFAEAKWSKPTSMSGPLTSYRGKNSDMRSTAFVRLTSRYVDIGTAKLCEIILPIDDKAFSLKPSPVPSPVLQQTQIAQAVQGIAPQNMQGLPPQSPQEPAAAMPPGMPPGMSGMPPGMPGAAPVDPALVKDDLATQQAKKAEKRIYDWMVEAKYPAEMRKVIKDAGRIGVGVVKGPFPDNKQSKAVVKINDAIALQIKNTVQPSVRWIDPWNFFPAEGCGEDIHDGDYVLERDFLSSRKLKKLKESDHYLKDQIDQVIEEGPNKVNIEGSNPQDKKSSKLYEVWYYYGTISRKDIELAIGDVSLLDDIPEDKQDVHAIITLVNDTIIRASLNPMDSGVFPYRTMAWSRRPGHWAGVGISEQLFMPQTTCNASTRALLNNAGASSGVQIVIDQLGIIPADGSWAITPNKIWYKTGDSTSADVRQSFVSIVIPSVFNELMGIVKYAMQLAEESTGIPLVTQGQDGPTTPQTFGQAELQNTNAHTWLRSIGYAFDDQITDPLVRDFYDWLLLDPEVPDDEKGDFQIDAHGSVAMVERAIQEQTLMGLLQASANPAFELNPAKLTAMYLKAKRLDPRECQLSDEEKAKRAQQPPMPPPQIAVAQIRAKADAEKTQAQLAAEAQKVQAEIASEERIASMENNTLQTRIKVDTDRDLAYVNAQAQRSTQEMQMRMQELALTKEIEILKYSTQQKISLEEAKVQLARDSMKLNVQRELAAASGEMDLHKHYNPPQVATPAVEPVGRAPDGQAFQK